MGFNPKRNGEGTKKLPKNKFTHSKEGLYKSNRILREPLDFLQIEMKFPLNEQG